MKPRQLHLPTLTLSLAMLAFMLVAPGGTAAVEAPTLDPASAYLQTHPNGTKLNFNEVQYGPLIVTVTQTVAASGADCPAGWFCFYDGRNYTFPRGKLSSCGWQDLTQYQWGNRIESAYYDLNNGSVTFYDRKSASNPNDDVSLFSLNTVTRGDVDTNPNRNKADYVYRIC